ncbi:MAG: hypothetical protein ACYCSF_03310 [Acidimicrobiales bacterium]
MEPLILRDEEPPDDAVVVVRGGVMASDSVRRSAQASMQLYGFFGLSVFSAAGLTAAELVASVPELGPDRYRQVRTSTVGRLRSAGFPLVPTQDHPHYDVVLPDLADPTLERLQTCFDPAVPNPSERMGAE